MLPPNWGNVPKNPICQVCACVEFGEDYVCKGCGEPLVVRPYPKKTVSLVIAADRWGEHWPADYEKRCFLCGWKSHKSLDDLIPTKAEEHMIAGIWASGPEAENLRNIICSGKTLSQRFSIIMGVLSKTGENALFKVAANNEYSKLAKKFEGKKLSFCRECAEKDAAPTPAQPPKPTSISLTDSMADTMSENLPPIKPDYTKAVKSPIKAYTEKITEDMYKLINPTPEKIVINEENWEEDWENSENSDSSNTYNSSIEEKKTDEEWGNW